MKKEFFLLSFLIFSGLSAFVYFSLSTISEISEEKIEKVDTLTKKDLTETKQLSFDIIRITKNGDAVMAGKAIPGKSIQLFDNENKIADILSDSNGEWVWSSNFPFQPGTKNFYLTYIDKNGNQIKSENSITVYLDDQKNEQPLVFKSNESGEKNSKLMYLYTLDKGILVDIAEYSSTKKLMLSGRTSSSRDISIYLNQIFIGETKPDSYGYWSFKTDAPIPLGHTNLILKTQHNGEQIRVETNILENLSINSKIRLSEKNVIVESGNSLWRIARKTLGGGILYTEIYKNNLSKIQDPNLIYPGQVFNIPIISKSVLK